MTFDDRDNYFQADFRDRLQNFYADYSNHKKFLTFGALLHTVKAKRLYLQWKYDTFSAYCQKDLSLVPVYHENLLISAYLRLRALQLDTRIMERLESTLTLRRILQVTKYVRDQETLLRVLNDPDVTSAELKSLAEKDRKKTARFAFRITQAEREFLDILQKELHKREVGGREEGFSAMLAISLFSAFRDAMTTRRRREICKALNVDYLKISSLVHG